MASTIKSVVCVLLAALAAVMAGGCSKKSPAVDLINAACAGNAAECERLVKGGVPVDATDGDGDTALIWAVAECKIDVVRKLIELGADVNHAEHEQRHGTPLLYTVIPLRGRRVTGPQKERNEIARLLILHGADVNHAMGDGRLIGDGATALHYAASDKNPELVRMLLAAGANRNVKSNQGYTPLDVAKFSDWAPNTEVINALEQPTPPTR
jgi:uncharacterized protein